MLQALPVAGRRLLSPAASATTVGTLVVAALTGYLAVSRPTLASLAVVLPLVFWLLSQRVIAVTALGVTMPYVADLSGGAVGVNVALSDLLMTMLVGGLLLEWVVSGRAFELRALAPLGAVVGQYAAVLAVLLVAHPEVTALVATAQRVELFVMPLLVGALLARAGLELWFLRAYVVGSVLTAALWIGGIELGQKNAIGQFIANALVMLLAVKPLRRRLVWVVPVLVAGVLWSQSRGAMLSVGVAFAVLLVVQPSARSRARSLALAVPVSIISYVAFRLLPEQAQERNLTFTSADESKGAWAIKIRELYHADAWAIIHDHPWTGVGLGKYFAGSVYKGTITDDPHQVLLLEAATGGFVLAGSFVVLVVGAVLVVRRVAVRTPLGPVAAAVTLAVAVHGLVDVYWVRGTPLPGWILVGAALGQALRAGRGDPGRGRATAGTVKDGAGVPSEVPS